jgi:predicted RNA methylase
MLAEKKFYEGLVNTSDDGCIIDVGAYRGDKTEIFLDLASRVVAIEPDPVSARNAAKTLPLETGRCARGRHLKRNRHNSIL